MFDQSPKPCITHLFRSYGHINIQKCYGKWIAERKKYSKWMLRTIHSYKWETHPPTGVFNSKLLNSTHKTRAESQGEPSLSNRTASDFPITLRLTFGPKSMQTQRDMTKPSIKNSTCWTKRYPDLQKSAPFRWRIAKSAPLLSFGRNTCCSVWKHCLNPYQTYDANYTNTYLAKQTTIREILAFATHHGIKLGHLCIVVAYLHKPYTHEKKCTHDRATQV